MSHCSAGGIVESAAGEMPVYAPHTAGRKGLYSGDRMGYDVCKSIVSTYIKPKSISGTGGMGRRSL